MAGVNPNVTLVGTLANIFNVTLAPNPDLTGTLEIALCGYGSHIPRVAGEALFSTAVTPRLATQDGIPPEGAGGSFEVMLYSNDLISPAGTYYTATIRNGNGDILQVNAYVFNGPGGFDLSTLTPYDPNQPPPPLPPLITSLLLVVPWSATPEFPGDVYTSFRIILTGDVTSSTAPNTVQGNLYTFIIFQDAVGEHQFTWPANFIKASQINPDPGSLTVQTFVMGVSDLVPIGAATWVE